MYINKKVNDRVGIEAHKERLIDLAETKPKGGHVKVVNLSSWSLYEAIQGLMKFTHQGRGLRNFEVKGLTHKDFFF